MTLLGTVARRALRAGVLLFALSASVFMLSRAMPGDAWTDLQADPSVSAQTLRDLRAEYGLDRPPLEQYARWLWQALHGRFGYSPVERLPVSALLRQRLVRTLALASETLVLIVAAAIAASWPIIFGQRSRWLDYGVIPMVLAVPAVLSALVVNWLRIHWFPPSYGSSPDAFGSILVEVWWPAVALAIPLAAFLAKQTRREVSAVLGRQYVEAARAKGLGGAAMLRAAFKPAAPVFINLAAFILASLMGGAVVAETVFDVPGMAC